MSYDIVYDNKFIKTTTGYIPLLLVGPNNVTTREWVGGKKKWAEVRVRKWSAYAYPLLNATEAEIMDFCKDHYEDVPYPEYEIFKRNGKWVCQKDMPNFFRSGIRHAQSLERLIQANPNQCLSADVIVYRSKDSCAYDTELSTCLRTTEGLEQWLKEAKALHARHTADGKSCYIKLGFLGTKPLVYASAENIGKVVVKSTSRRHPGYVSDYHYDPAGHSSISFSPDLEKACIFDSEDAARDALGNTIKWQKIKFVSFAGQQKANMPKPFVLQFQNGSMSDRYLYKSTSSKIYSTPYTSAAQRFASEKEATAKAQALRKRGCNEARFGKFVAVNTDDGSRTELAV